MSLNNCPEILEMAEALQVPPSDKPGDAIVAHCKAKVQGWLKGRKHGLTLSEAEAIVCEKLQLEIVEVRTDEELHAVIRKYVDMGELAFAGVTTELDETTFGVLLERSLATQLSPDRFVAIIDSRGKKKSRSFFTRWHEIAHLLTFYKQLVLPMHRSREGVNPMERLMDKIAAEIGFLNVIFQPILAAQVKRDRTLSFGTVDAVRETSCPSASFQATLKACVAQCTFPVIYLEASVRLKKSELEASATGPRATPKLRATVVLPNQVIGDNLGLHPQIEVPASSVIYRAFHGDESLGDCAELVGPESLETWKHSDGTTLAEQKVIVQARRFRGGVYAMIRPTV